MLLNRKSGRLSVLLIALCLLFSAIHTVAENTVRLLTMSGYFTIYGVHDLSPEDGSSSDIGATGKYYVDALQKELDKALDFVQWRLVITEYISVGNQQNDDYATGELHFEVQAYLQPGDDEAQYFREVVETLNFVLADDLTSNAPLDSMRGAHITAGSLTIADTISISEGHTNKPTSRPVVTPEKLHLLMLGDWGKGGLNGDITGTSSSSVSRVASFSNRQLGGKSGGTDYTYQASIARSMMKYVRHLNLRAVITLGDNFYTSGVTSTTDTLWTTIWKNVYLAENSPLNVPWYAVLGNHDYGSSANAEAQINRHIKSDIDDDNWRMPSHNYTQMFDIVGGGVVQIIFIDTTTLAPSVNKCCNEKGLVGAYFA